MSAPIRVRVLGSDPITTEGTRAYLRAAAGFEVVPDPPPPGAADVTLLLATDLGPNALARLGGSAHPVVLVAGRVRRESLLRAVELGVVVLLPRDRSDLPEVTRALTRAAGGGAQFPEAVLAGLLAEMRRLHTEVLTVPGLTAGGLEPRELDVLRLLAEGFDTAEIADRLQYSERTIKSVIQALLKRLSLRNRSHAVAYALRTGAL